MGKVPRVDLTDPSVEPTDEELRALMLAVRDSVIERGREAKARFQRRLDRAIHGEESDPPARHKRHESAG